MIRTACTLAFMTLAALTPPVAAQEAIMEDTMRRTVTVIGTGTVTAPPDIARIDVGVEEKAETAAEALRRNTAQMDRLVAALDTMGVAPRDRQTSNLSLTPDIRYRPDGEAPVLDGYTATNTLTLRLRDLARMGDLLDALVTAGGNRIGGISFEISDMDARLDEARSGAIEDARRKAALYAEGAEAEIGRIVSISEAGTSLPPRPVMMQARGMAMSEAVPIEAGEQTIDVRVSAVWEITPR